MIYDPVETLARDELGALQASRLRALVDYLVQRVPFYRDAFAAVGVTAADIESVDDVIRLPFTHKSDLRDHYPFGLFAVPLERVERIHASSGTTGKPTVVGYTKSDVELFAQVNCRSLAMGGAEPEMMLHNAYGYGLFTGGLGLHYGAERLGMTVVPVSGGMTARQITLITDFRPDVIACTPSYALTLAQEFHRRDISPDQISLRFAIVGAEPWSEAMRVEIDAGLGVRTTNIYGLSEVIGPGVSCECLETRDGSHINEDHFLPEVVHPETGERVPEGESGVLVFTTLTKQAMPLVRYWTGDIASLSSAPCACGRTLIRMSAIIGRADDMLIIRGVNVYPSQVADVLGRINGLSSHYQLVVSRERTLDDLEIRVELDEALLEADENELQRIRASVTVLIKDTIGCTATVSLLAPGALPRSDGGKLGRVVDNRSASSAPDGVTG